MTLKVGDPAPNIVGIDKQTGQRWELAAQAPKTVLLAFSGLTWCGPCQQEAPALVEFWKLFEKSDDFGMAIISVGDDTPEFPPLTTAIAKFKITFPVIKQPNDESRAIYCPNAVPMTYCLRYSDTAARYEVCAIHEGMASGQGTAATVAFLLKLVGGCGAKPPKGSVLHVDRPEIPPIVQPIPPIKVPLPELVIRFGTDGPGWTIKPGEPPAPIPPWNPATILGGAARDVLVGLRVAELSADFDDPHLRLAVRRAGIDAAKSAVARLEQEARPDAERKR